VATKAAAKSRESFRATNARYEKWLRRQCEVDENALHFKHCRMRESAFAFLRATFFRWASEIEAVLPDLTSAPAIPAVGDAHVQNFGIWHDLEGRLVWGVNDFDDAAVIPYPFDLVRLAVSAKISGKTGFSRGEICADIMKGYRVGLESSEPYVLNEKHWWLRRRVHATEKSIGHFWKEIDKAKKRDELPADKVPKEARRGLRSLMPKDCEVVAFARRVAGGGSLGRPRFIVIACWRGGRIVREAKALVQSAWDWSHKVSSKPRFLHFANGRSRSPDPNLHVRNGYLLRDLSPEARKLELGNDEDIKIDHRLLRAMGRELGAIHGTDRARAKQIKAHLNEADANWLTVSAKKAEDFVRSDFAAWKRATSRLKCPK